MMHRSFSLIFLTFLRAPTLALNLLNDTFVADILLMRHTTDTRDGSRCLKVFREIFMLFGRCFTLFQALSDPELLQSS